MDFPKMRIVIYVLTFLGYAYTGYGANVITNLRDAVLFAENVFGDFLSNVASAARNFKSVSDLLGPSLDENCIYTCPGGGKAVPNKQHKPSSNGCGTETIKIVHDSMPLADVTACCNEHDICYDTCNSDKEKCDFAMRRCLYRICDKHASVVGDMITNGCKALAKTLFTGTMTLGCKPYLDAQKKACYCQTKFNKYSGGEL